MSSGQVLSLKFAAPFDFDIQLRRRRSNSGRNGWFVSLRSWFRLRRQLSCCNGGERNHFPEWSQITWVRLFGVGWSYFACPPRAKQAGQECREVRLLHGWHIGSTPIGEDNQMALHGSHFLKQFQWIEREEDLTIICLSISSSLQKKQERDKSNVRKPVRARRYWRTLLLRHMALFWKNASANANLSRSLLGQPHADEIVTLLRLIRTSSSETFSS